MYMYMCGLETQETAPNLQASTQFATHPPRPFLVYVLIVRNEMTGTYMYATQNYPTEMKSTV